MCLLIEALFFHLSVDENIRLGFRRGSNIRIADALDCFPALKPLLNRRCGLLSGGEQQMLGDGTCAGRRVRVLLSTR